MEPVPAAVVGALLITHSNTLLQQACIAVNQYVSTLAGIVTHIHGWSLSLSLQQVIASLVLK